MNSTRVFFSTFFAVLLTFGSASAWPNATSGGVVLHGLISENGVLENTNTYPVRVRHVSEGFLGGEPTKSIYYLNPDAKLSIGPINYPDGFYIYNIDGGLIGWISGNPYKNKS